MVLLLARTKIDEYIKFIKFVRKFPNFPLLSIANTSMTSLHCGKVTLWHSSEEFSTLFSSLIFSRMICSYIKFLLSACNAKNRFQVFLIQAFVKHSNLT